MARKKKGGVRGRKSDFTGEKMDWLDGFREQLKEAGKDPGPVYTEATHKFILRYGYDLPFKDNVEGDPENDPPVIEPATDAAEKEHRAEIQINLRQKLSNYFRNRWRAKKLHAGMIQGILGTMQTMTGPRARPRRKPALGLYSKLHYTTRVKPEFDAIWAEASKTLPLKERVAMSQDYTRTCWGKESDEFKDALEKEAEELHRAEIEQWKAARTIPEGSAEEYHEAMESLSEVGIPMADALAERLGSHVVILVVGPVGSEKGEVCLRTVFSDTSSLQTSRTWAAFDHAGFTAMEASITRYGRAAFSRSQCKERAWPSLDGAGLPVLNGMIHIDPGVPPPVAHVARNTMATATPAAATTTPTPALVPAEPSSPLTPAPSMLGSTHTPAPALNSTPAPAPNSTPVATSDVLMLDAASSTLTSDTPSALAVTSTSAATQWSGSLLTAHTYLSQKNWGPRWTALLDALVAYEASHGHPEEDGKLPKLRTRPQEFHDWMKEHRIFKDYTVTAKFGAELFEWWRDLGPQNRWKEVGEAEDSHWEASRIHTDFWSIDWGKLGKRGRNGMVLLILGLAWWGQSVCNAAVGEGLGAGEVALQTNQLWQLMVEDVWWVLKEVLPQPQMVKADAERERLLLGAEVSEERVEGGGKTKKGKGKTKKTAAPKTVAPKIVAPKTVASKPSAMGTKRKRNTEEDLPIAKKISPPTHIRPKPRPLTRGSGVLQELDENEAPEGSKTSGEIILPAAAGAATHTGSGEMTVPVPGQTAIAANIGIFMGAPPAETSHPLPKNAVAQALPSSPSVAPLGLAHTPSFESFSPTLSPPPVILTHLEPSVMRAVHMDVDTDSGSGIDVELSPAHHVDVTTKTPVPDDGDPFADGSGFTAEELAEMALDPEAEENEDEEEEE